MSKEDTTPGGLLSKVVRFVKNPTVNWTELADRMRYIADLFRSRQLDAALQGGPFTVDQRRQLDAGLPVTGPL